MGALTWPALSRFSLSGLYSWTRALCGPPHLPLLFITETAFLSQSPGGGVRSGHLPCLSLFTTARAPMRGAGAGTRV